MEPKHPFPTFRRVLASATVLSSLIDWGGGDESELAAREIVTYFPKSDSHINRSF